MTIPLNVLIIGVVFCLCFGVESIFGFGGTILALTFLSFFFDIKEMVALSIFTGFIASIFIFFSEKKSFNKVIYGKILLASIPGLVLGSLFLKNFSSEVIVYIFAGFLIVFSGWTILSPKISVPSFLKPVINFMGGLFSGILGAPGPFFVASMKDIFQSKAEMRITFAAVFMTLNLLRFPLYIQNEVLDFEKVIPFWWIIIPLLLTIWLGYKIHVKISERFFQVGISILLCLAGFSLLF